MEISKRNDWERVTALPKRRKEKEGIFPYDLSMKKLVFCFDQDGTLLASAPGILEAARTVLNEHGFYPDEEAIKTFIGPPIRVCFSQFGVPEDELQECIDEFRHIYETKTRYNATIYPGMEHCLGTLQSLGVPLYVVSSKQEYQVRAILAHFQLDHYFTALHGASDERPSKTLILKKAISTMEEGTTPIMVGDTRYDIEAAHEAGAVSIAVSYGYGTEESIRAAKPDYEVDSADELLELALKLLNE